MEATPLQLSIAVALPLADADVSAALLMEASAGQVMEGPCVSVMVIVCTQVEELPQLSVAVHVRVMI